MIFEKKTKFLTTYLLYIYMKKKKHVQFFSKTKQILKYCYHITPILLKFGRIFIQTQCSENACNTPSTKGCQQVPKVLGVFWPVGKIYLPKNLNFLKMNHDKREKKEKSILSSIQSVEEEEYIFVLSI